MGSISCDNFLRLPNANLCTSLTDARLETPQQVACHALNCGGMSSLESVLDFLRQLGVVVEVRTSKLHTLLSCPPECILPGETKCLHVRLFKYMSENWELEVDLAKYVLYAAILMFP